MDDQRAAHIREAYVRLFNTDDGATVLKDLMRAHYVQSPLPPGEREFAEGQRNVVLRILAIINKDLTNGIG